MYEQTYLPTYLQSLRLSSELSQAIVEDLGQKISTVTFGGRFNVSSQDFWYLKKPMRLLRLLAQVGR